MEIPLLKDSAFLQAWQLEYTECAYRAFYLQMLLLYSLSISPKSAWRISAEAMCIAVIPRAADMPFSDVPFGFATFVNTATYLSATAFGYLSWCGL